MMQSIALSREKLSSLTRKELVATSKQHGQKAGGTSIQLIEALLLLGDDAVIGAEDHSNDLSDVVMLEEIIVVEQKLDDIKNDDVISDSQAGTNTQSTDLTHEKLALLTRKELIATSEKHGQKASGTSIQLIEALLPLGDDVVIETENNDNILSNVVMLKETVVDVIKVDNGKDHVAISDSHQATNDKQSTDLTREKLVLLTRKELIATSKLHGQKAGGTSVQLIEALLLLDNNTDIAADEIKSSNKSKSEEGNNDKCMNIIDINTEILNLDANLHEQEVEHFKALETEVSSVILNEGKKKRRTSSILKADTLPVTESKPIISERKRDSRTLQRTSLIKGLNAYMLSLFHSCENSDVFFNTKIYMYCWWKFIEMSIKCMENKSPCNTDIYNKTLSLNQYAK
jgi:hypothetical protein